MKHVGGLSSRRIATLSAISWLGMVEHNLAELPDMPLYRREYAFPIFISLALVYAWHSRPQARPIWTVLLATWTAIHLLIRGVLSVIPLTLWPSTPEQSPGRYAAHLIYAGAQLPLLAVLWNTRDNPKRS